MKLEEIREGWKGKWVLIEYQELDRNLEVVEGEVIAEAPTKEEIYKVLLTTGRGKPTAIRYCGEWPTDIGLMFWLNLQPDAVRQAAAVQCAGNRARGLARSRSAG